ncbi:MAG: hypothetical protein QXU61_04525, partial [Archaeoglobaceae archaeon]
MRFSIRKCGTNSETNTSFNSLFEIHSDVNALKELKLRKTFNSLFEILTTRLESVIAPVRPFNSLFEILHEKQIVRMLDKLFLSIL